MKEIEINLFPIGGFISAIWGFLVETKHREALELCMHGKANFYYLFCSTSKTN